MKIQYLQARILKIILAGLLVICVGIAVVNWRPSETQKSLVESENIDVPHSFTIAATGLTKGEQSTKEHSIYRLNKYDIEKALMPTFECKGLKIEENHTLTIDDMIIPLSGYDPKLKIGYVWLDHDLFGEGIIDKSYTQYINQKKAEQVFLNQVESGIELFFDDQDRFLLDIFGEEPLDETEESSGKTEVSHDEKKVVFLDPSAGKLDENNEFFKQISKHNSMTPKMLFEKSVNVTRTKWNFFKEAYSDPEMLYRFGQEIKASISELQISEDRKEYLEIIFIEFKKMIFLNDQNLKKNKTFIDDWIFSASKMIDDPIRFFGFVERIKYLGFPNASNPLTKAIDSEILKINLTTDKKKWWEHSAAVINLLQTNKTAAINSKWEHDFLIAEIINNYPYQKWSEHYYKIDDLSNKYTISMEELEALPALAATHGICIAPLSILDDRTNYDMQEQEYQDKLKDLRKKINQTKDKSQRKSYKKDLMDFSQHRSLHYGKIRDEAKAKSMQKIIEDMEYFIDWAKDMSADWKSRRGA